MLAHRNITYRLIPGSRARASAVARTAGACRFTWNRFEFRRQLDYKAAWNGGRLVAVPPQYTSQECSACGHTAKANRRSQECFICTACGFDKHADWNAAINIRRAGLARIACEVSGVSRQQQEPTEATWRRASPGSGAVGIPVV